MSENPTNDISMFTFGDPVPALNQNMYDGLGVQYIHNGRYYETPVPWRGLARLLRANAYHGPILEFKTNVVMRGFTGSAVLKRRDMLAATTDYNVFLNAFFQLVKNGFGEVVAVKHLPAINMRKHKDTGRYCMLTNTGEIIKFQVGEVAHLKNYDVAQNIYGLPSYLGAIQSMLLNEDATLFRRRYYKNGAHMGYIFYVSSSGVDDATVETLKEKVSGTKGVGNFQNMFLHIPDGKEKGVQILPVGDFSTKDELEKIKNISRDDIIAAHRIPPVMASIIPTNNGGFGDITKIDSVYEKNEVQPIRENLMEINEYLLPKDHVTFPKPVDDMPPEA
ncbi:MAG: phage portal protein [Desulfovibrio sp.]